MATVSATCTISLTGRTRPDTTIVTIAIPSTGDEI
jgi:hypothetical protein